MKTGSLCSLRSALRVILPTGLAAIFLVLGLAVAQGTENLIRITTATGAGDRDSYLPSLSADGKVVAFYSDSDFLDHGIPDGQKEIWLYDTATITLTRITIASDSNRNSQNPSLSADGKVVAFNSDSDFLGQGIADNQYEIWLYDTTTMTYTRITTASASNRNSGVPALSADGTVMAFQSDSDFLGQGIADNQFEIWLCDTTTMTLTRVTTASDSNRDNRHASLSVDGTVVAFDSDSDFLGQGIVDNQYEIWLYDSTTTTYTRITTASDSSRDSQYPSLSADGTVVAFRSDSDFLSQGIAQGQYEIWLYDTTTMTYTRITTASTSNRSSQHPYLTPDRKLITFYSDSDFLSQGILDDQYEVWLYDTMTITYTRVTTSSDSNRDSTYPCLSADGTVIAFQSDSDLSGQGIPDDQVEIWLKKIRYRVYLPLVLKGD